MSIDALAFEELIKSLQANDKEIDITFDSGDGVHAVKGAKYQTDDYYSLLFNNRIELNHQDFDEISEALASNSVWQNLRTNNAGIDATVAKALAAMLKVNRTISKLGFANESLGDEGAIALAEAIKQNHTITEIDLSGCNIGDRGAEAIAEALKANPNITRITLSRNNIGDKGAIAIANALKDHPSIEAAYLDKNQIGDAGGVEFGKALKGHSTWKILLLSENQMGCAAAKSIADGFKGSAVFRVFQGNENRFKGEGAIALAKAAAQTPNMTSLLMRGDEYDEAAQEQLLEILKDHPNLVSLSGIQGNDSDRLAGYGLKKENEINSLLWPMRNPEEDAFLRLLRYAKNRDYIQKTMPAIEALHMHEHMEKHEEHFCAFPKILADDITTFKDVVTPQPNKALGEDVRVMDNPRFWDETFDEVLAKISDLKAEDMLREEEGRPSFLQRIVDCERIGTLFSEKTWLGSSPGQMKRVYRALPESERMRFDVNALALQMQRHAGKQRER